MSDTQTKCTIAHELSHVAHDDLCNGDDAVEARADREASHLLIPPMAYAEAELVYGPDIHKIVEEIGVTTHLALTWRDTFERTPMLLEGTGQCTTEVEGESFAFDDIRDLAESMNATPGEAFTVTLDLRESLGEITVEHEFTEFGNLEISEAEKAAWNTIIEDSGYLEVTARIWTSRDWEDGFYASVRVDLPGVEDAEGQIEENRRRHRVEIYGTENPTPEQVKRRSDEQLALSNNPETARKARERLARPDRQEEREPMSNSYPDPNANQYPQQSYAPQSQIPQGYVTQGAPIQGYAPQGQPVDPMAMQRAMMQYEDAKKSTAAAWILWVFLGAIGGHRYYLGDIVQGIAMTLTLGGLGVWALIDAFFINRRLRTKNGQIRTRVFTNHGIPQMA